MALGRPQVRLDVGGGAHVYYKRTSALPAGADVSAFSELIENATVTVGVGNQVGRRTATDPAPSSSLHPRTPVCAARAAMAAQMRLRRVRDWLSGLKHLRRVDDTTIPGRAGF